jgi:SAM-dependent methyltransferase
MHIRDWLVYHIGERALKAALLEAFAQNPPGRLLDLGCGSNPYVGMTAGHVTKHIGLDHPTSGHDRSAVDVSASAYAIPFRSDTFTTVMCSSVLEHLEEPEAALRETARIMAPEACAVFITPFIWHIHEEPRDFYRYSRYGLEHLFTKAGFDRIEVRPLSGFWVTFGQLFVHQLYRLQRGPMRWIPVIPLLGLVIQLVALLLDALDRAPGSRKWTWAYLTVARKPTP